MALGFGFRCGFLGLLHMEIIQERLEREYDLDLITTAPSVIYRITLNDGDGAPISTTPPITPTPVPSPMAEEPIANAHILAPTDYVGNIMELCQQRRGVFKDMKYLDPDPGGHPLRAALKRNHIRLFRRAQIPDQGLRQL